MAIARGVNAFLAVQKETTFNTLPASPDTKLVYFINESLAAKRDMVDDAVIRGTRDAVPPVATAFDVSGSITTNLEGKSLSRLFFYALGSVTTTGTSPYVHTIKVAPTIPSFLIEKAFTDITKYIRFEGCKINSFSIDFAANERPQVSFDIVGAGVTHLTSPYDSTPTDNGYAPFSPYHISSLLEGGTTLSNAVRINRFSFSNNLAGDLYLLGGGGERADLPEGIVKVSGTLQVMFEDFNLLNKALNSTESSLKIIYSIGSGNGSNGNEYCEFYVPKLTYALNSPVIDGPRGVLAELDFTGYYTGQTETSLQITIKNNIATINN